MSPSSDNATAPPESSKRRLVRGGVVVVIIGFLGALAGAMLLAHGPRGWERLSSVLHRLSLLVMFAGFCTLLLAYRIDWWRDMRSKIQRGAIPLGHAWGDPGAGRRGQRISLALVVAYVLEPITFLVLPPSFVALLVICTVLFVPPVLTILIIHGDRWQRTFAIGALFPAGLGLLTTVQFSAVAGTGPRFPGPMSTILELIAAVLQDAFPWPRPLANLVALMFVWLLVPVTGFLTMGLAWLLKLQNAPRSTPPKP